MKFFKNKFNRAFTLVEFMVVFFISTVIMTTLIIEQSRWDDQLEVNAQSYEFVLMLRQAQIYALGVREHTGVLPDRFNVGYGVSISVNNPNSYVFFVDRNLNGRFDDGESIETKELKRGVSLDSLCDSDRCRNVGGGGQGQMRQIDITFLRPEVGANILFINQGGVVIGENQSRPPATINLVSRNGIVSSIRIESNGQVSIQ